MQLHKMRYRLALDIGTTSIGWAILRLNNDQVPVAIIRAGVRIFGDGRNPKDGTSLAVSRRTARGMRRNRDRKLKRKAKIMQALIDLAFFPKDEASRKALDHLDPYQLRAKGLDKPLTPAEFARALFHLNQRRGFKSNRKTDKKDNESGALKSAIKKLRESLQSENVRTVGEWLSKRHAERLPVRARYREEKILKDDGKTRLNKFYDLYTDRAMIENEFDQLWTKQAEFNPQHFTQENKDILKGILLHQRPLKPVKPGRCTFFPEEERASLALPSTQVFRILQELNNLATIQSDGKEMPLTLEQRDKLFVIFDKNSKQTFTQIAKSLSLGGGAKFNLQDAKRDHLKGNTTSAILSDDKNFGLQWHSFSLSRQDEIVIKLLKEEDESALIKWLMAEFSFNEAQAERIATLNLPEGYGSLSEKALALILPKLQAEVITFAAAAKSAGFHHSVLSHGQLTGEIMDQLPYYGEPLQRHVGFGTNDPKDSLEKRVGKIANPTVHIGLNQLRKVVNELIKRYGHPSEVIVEVTRELKQSREKKNEIQKEQAARQKQNDVWRAEIKAITDFDALGEDLKKMKLWTELSYDVLDRRCPYTGEQINLAMLFTDAVEIEHILPFSRTLDDSLNNLTVCLRRTNRDKGNRTPFEAFGHSPNGYDYAAILARAAAMPLAKRKRFAPDGYERWLKEDKDFLARALNDTAYLSRIAKEYLSLICPHNKVRSIPGRLTAMLRGKFGLNDVLGLRGEKNRNDHRHHAVDACVIGITDQGMLQRFAKANSQAREKQLSKLVESMPDPFPTNNYRDHVARAVSNIIVSHKPDHNHEGEFHNSTAYGLVGDGMVAYTRVVEGKRVRDPEKLEVIEFAEPNANHRHGTLPDGSPRPYKGYKGDSNYCMEITRNEKGKWEGEVISTFEAYQIVRKHGVAALRDPKLSAAGKPLVMRLMKNDYLKLEIKEKQKIMRITTISANGQFFMAEHHEANVDSRNRDKTDQFGYISKKPGSLMQVKGRRISISPIGDVNDAGFKT
jgi:CRISPR-associated endonuclease Csn1